MPDEKIIATYHIETPHPLREAAEAMAGEQSSGTFVDVPGETEALQERHAARVTDVVELGTTREPTLPRATPPEEERPIEYTQAVVTISFPLENLGLDLPNLRTMVGGNLFELRQFTGMRLKDIEVPAGLADACPGPAYGIDGTRELLDIWDRPIIGTIVKPSVGLSPAETGDLVDELVTAGVDFIKDDELIANPPYSPVRDRIEAVMDVIHRHEDATGERTMYACNITGDVDTMCELHDVVADAGGNCVMVSVNNVGIAGVLALRDHAELPIHAHRNGWGALSRHPLLGFDFPAYQLFWRLAGVDHIHVNGIRNKFCESDASVMRSAQVCQTPVEHPADTIMPVFSSGQWAGQAPETYAALGNADLMYLCGGGIMGHPDGPTAGVEHLRQGWEAAMEGIPLEEHADHHEELRQAIEHFGPVGSGR